MGMGGGDVAFVSKYLMPQGSAASSKRSFIVRTRREIKCVEDEDEKRKTGNALSVYNRISPRKRIEDEYTVRADSGELIREDAQREKWIWACNICNPLNRVAILG